MPPIMHLSGKLFLRILYWNLVLAVLVLALGFVLHMKKLHRYDRMIVEVSREYHMDPRLATAVIWAESRFKPMQVGAAGEIGLMQVTEPAAQEWADATNRETFQRDDLFDPLTNLHAGCWYLGRAIRYWKNKVPDPIPYALAEYNAGRSNARRWADPDDPNARRFVERITYPTTKKYITLILQRYRGGI